MIKIVLPFPPSVNTAYPTIIKGRKPVRIKSEKLKAWIKSCGEIDIKLPEPCRISYVLYFPDDRPRDGQNYIKVVLDFLVSSGALSDDNRKVVTGEQWTDGGIDRERPRIEIYIKEYEDGKQ